MLKILMLFVNYLIFKSINDIYYLIYATEQQSIISYDLFENKKINEIKKVILKIFII